MPPIPGKHRKQQAFFCAKCSGRDITVERGTNSRVIHGVRRTVANAVCNNKQCRNEWWSYHPEAIERSRAADAAEPTRVARKKRPGANEGDVDRTEP
jgi:hypothetical protein